MTRSEKLDRAIRNAHAKVSEIKRNAGMYTVQDSEVAQFTLSILLAEQNRVDGCDKCNDDRIREIQIDSGFEFCPHCGRDLTEGESV